jgi:hypothetical protein
MADGDMSGLTAVGADAGADDAGAGSTGADAIAGTIGGGSEDSGLGTWQPGGTAGGGAGMDAPAASQAGGGWSPGGIRSTGAFDDDEEEEESASAAAGASGMTGASVDDGSSAFNAWDRPGAMSTINVASGDDTQDEAVPATEDTVSAGSGGFDAAAMGGESMPGVVPMMGAS